MEQLNLITNFLRIKDKNIIITNEYDMGTHKELHGYLDYEPPKCPACKGQMGKYDYQKASKIPYLECAGYQTLIRLKKRRFKCKECGKMAVAETSLVKKNHQIANIVRQKIVQLLIEKQSMTDITKRLAVSTSTVIRKLNEFQFKTDWNWLPENISWDEYGFKKGKMSFIAQDFDSLKVITILDGRTQATIRNHFLRYSRQARNRVKVITMDMFSPYYQLAKQLFPHAKIVLDRFHIVQHLSRAMMTTRIDIMKTFDTRSLPYRSMKNHWRILQKDSRKLSRNRFYSRTFGQTVTPREVVQKTLDFSNELKFYYELYQILLFHFQEMNSKYFFELLEDNLDLVNPAFKTVFKTFLKYKTYITNAMELPYSNAKLEATNKLIKDIKRQAFGFRNFTNFKTKIYIALNIKNERTNFVLSRC
ncbi:ISL3 family transposase [Streptococcus suis]|uniref:ISL3 family transposase n=1 Tax=Streptococcus suis TaxID=1307 RepID=A0A3R8M2Z3_STRSU|nr:ISL3 family transposase [Streptococcus suis]RRN52002.1 ISL3 family transposase [Streptococcus suis]